MIAIGIGLHNMGEGLAIGSAYALGELALGAFLVIGFAIHNTTEGLAIVAPLAQDRETPKRRLLALGLIAGAPAILGAVIGASVYNQELATFLLGIGVGAIVQVIVQLTPAIRDDQGRALNPLSVAGIVAGIALMYRPDCWSSICDARRPRPQRAPRAPKRRGRRELRQGALPAAGPMAQGEAVGTGAVAEQLGVTPASASAMLKRLADEGLVELPPLPRRPPDRRGRAARARDDPPPPADRALPGRGARRCRGIGSTPRPRCSSTTSPRSSRS